MIKTKRIFLTSVIIITCIALVMTAFACSKNNNKDEDNSDKVTELFTNGNFTEYTTTDDDKSAYTPTSWSGNPGSNSSSATIKTPQSSSDLQAGVIDITSKKLGSNFSISNPDKVGEDNYVLMLHNITATSYNFKSSSVSLNENEYYKLKLSVKTIDVAPGTEGDVYGAWITISGDAYASFEAINTNGEWKEYTIYFRGSTSGSSSINVTLSLGTGNLETGHMTTGYAFFDNVVLENLSKVEEGEEEFTSEKFNAIEYTDSVYKYDLRYPDPHFNSISSEASLPYTTPQYSGKAGAGTGNAASTSSSYLEKGIIDISEAKGQYKFSALGSTPYDLDKIEGSIGDRMLFIHNKQLTAYSFTSNLGFNIEKASYYKITISVKAEIVSGSGAMVALSNDSTNVIKSEPITSNTWQSISFYLEGASYVDNSVNIVLSLGTGGSGDNDWVQGVAFFDELYYEEIEKSEYETAKVNMPNNCKSFATGNGDEINLNTIVENPLKSTAPATTNTSIIDVNNWDHSDFANIDNPGYILEERPNVLVINNYLPTAFSMSTLPIVNDNEVDETNLNLIKILPNTAYEFSFWVKTKDIKTGYGVDISLVAYNKDKKNDYENAFDSILSATKINSEDLKDLNDEKYDYIRFTMYVMGANKETTYAALQIKFGNGDSGLKSSDFLSGYFFMTNFESKIIDDATYSSVSTATNILKTSLGGTSSSGTLSSNGYFDSVDVSASKELDPTIYSDEGALVKAGIPTDWTCTNSSLLTANGGSSTAGVVDINSGFVSIDNPSSVDSNDHSNVLYINAVNVTSLGYKSTSISLNANSYYLVSVFAKCTLGSFSIDVAPSTNTDVKKTSDFYLNSEVGSDWNLYLVYIKTGITSVSATVTLYAGYPANTAQINSTVFFTSATYTEIEKDIYNKAEEAHDAIVEPDYTKINSRTTFKSWIVDTMDATTSAVDTLSTPSNWTGSAVDNDSKATTEYVQKGLFNQTTGDWKTINIDPDPADSLANKIFNVDKDGDAIGDSVLVIYNKDKTTYSYKTSNFSLNSGSYYKISIDILTNNLAYLQESDIKDKDDTIYDKYSSMNLLETATITLSINNKNYTFGNSVVKDKQETDFENADEYAKYKLNNLRLVNNDEWTTYSFFIALDDNIEGTINASLKLALGGKNVNYWMSGYLFADNFIVEELSKEAYEAKAPVGTCEEPEDSENYDYSKISDEDASTNFKIKFTSDDAEAEEEKETEPAETKPKKETSWAWLYITSGVIGGVMIVVVVIYLIKKFAPKKKIKKSKKKTITSDSTRGKFSD